MRLRVLLCSGLFPVASCVHAAALDFNRDIQPILSENCYHCHGPDAAERKGDLRLDEEKAAREVHDGTAAVVPGSSRDSTLIQRIFSTDPDEVMPTPKSNRKLTDAQKQMLKQWIDEGAKWGRHWAFEAPRKPQVPVIAETGLRNKDWRISANPIDAFVARRLAAEKFEPAPRADTHTLARRLSLDLTGLPPTPEELAAFEQASTRHPQAAFVALVDRLLASPRFGERWAWDWLDAARYADTNGYQGDPERTMWPWRDWIVQAVNSNMPYDQFTVWQLAGDLLPGATPEQKLATGFNRNHMINGEGGRIAEETRVENVMDRVETTSTIWLGLTVGCCRCHDHKFDPLTLKDYFALYDCFNQTSEDGKSRSGQAAPAMDLSTAAEKDRLTAAQQKVDATAKAVEEFELKKFPRPVGKPLSESDAIKLPGNLPSYIAKTEPKNRGVDPLLESVSYFKDKDPAYSKLLQSLLAAAREKANAASSITRVMVMDMLPRPRETFVLEKGAYDKPTAVKVSFNVPASLPPLPKDAPQNRLGLAQWIVARENPLTARVTVNRFWQAFFGIGLVKTAEDFGVQGEKPAYQDMLDWLAIGFMESGWDVKALMRLIVTSQTYQQSSKTIPHAGSFYSDPDNRLLARGPRHRLPSWMLRDQALFVAGLLADKPGGPAVKPYQPEGIWEEATFGKKSYQQDHGDALYRRTLYTFWRRIVGPTLLFDNAARQTCVVKATRTNTPLHALVTLNDITYVEAGRMMAQRVLLARLEGDTSRLTHAFRLAACRAPAEAEMSTLAAQLTKLRLMYARDSTQAQQLLSVGESRRNASIPAIEHAAWTGLCLLLLNLDEVLSKE